MILSSSDPAELSIAAREHLDRCPACRRILEQTRWTSRLIGLKRYERPGEGAEICCVASVRRHIERWEANRPIHAKPSPLEGWPAPGLVYATLAISALMWSVLLAGTSHMPSLSSTLSPESMRVREVSRMLSLTNGAELHNDIPASEFGEFSNEPPWQIERSQPAVRFVIGPPR